MYAVSNRLKACVGAALAKVIEACEKKKGYYDVEERLIYYFRSCTFCTKQSALKLAVIYFLCFINKFYFRSAKS